MEYPKYPWYIKLHDSDISLEQGDLIPLCPIIIPPDNLKEGRDYKALVQKYDVIIISQSCDLVNNNRVEIVQVCAYSDIDILYEGFSDKKKTSLKMEDFIDRLKKGSYPSFHIITRDQSVGIKKHLVVDFHKIFGIHKNSLLEHIKSYPGRIRLMPPYREHLSQSFARYFMRVGLPIEIH